jgi:hypothetical protein
MFIGAKENAIGEQFYIFYPELAVPFAHQHSVEKFSTLIMTAESFLKKNKE